MLGRVQQAKGDIAGARALFEEALVNYGESSSDVALAMARLRIHVAELAESSNDPRTAEETYAIADPVFREFLDSAHPDIAWLEVAIGRVRCRNGKPEDGSETIRASRPQLERGLGADNWQLARVDETLGDCVAP